MSILPTMPSNSTSCSANSSVETARSNSLWNPVPAIIAWARSGEGWISECLRLKNVLRGLTRSVTEMRRRLDCVWIAAVSSSLMVRLTSMVPRMNGVEKGSVTSASPGQTDDSVLPACPSLQSPFIYKVLHNSVDIRPASPWERRHQLTHHEPSTRQSSVADQRGEGSVGLGRDLDAHLKLGICSRQHVKNVPGPGIGIVSRIMPSGTGRTEGSM